MRRVLALALASTLGSLPPSRAGAEAGVEGLRLVAADARGVTLEYRLPEVRQALETTEEGEFTRLEVNGLGAVSEPGQPALPAGGTWIALPPVGSYTVRILEQETETLEGLDLLPVYRPEFVPDADLGYRPVRLFAREPAVYESNDVFPAAVAAIEGEAWLRFQRVGLLRLHPIRYQPLSRRVTLSRRLVVRVEFESPSSGAGALAPAGLAPAPAHERGFEGIYRGAILNYEQGRAWRARRAVDRFGLERAPGAAPGAGPGEAAQGTGNPEWKVRIDTTGVWRLDFTQLATAGFPADLPIASLAAFVRDTTASLQPVPWTSVELAIDVEDANTNGFFDLGDFLVLPVQSWADRDQPSLAERRYGDAQIVWVSYWTGSSGRRVRPAAGWVDALAPVTPASFPSFRRYERDFFYLQYPDRNRFPDQDQLYWTSGFTDGSPIDTLRADLLDLDAAGSDLLIRAQWTGNTPNTHSVSATWASAAGETPLWTNQSFGSKSELTVGATIPASAASEGINRLRISGSGGAVGSGAPFNWFEATYPRLYRARNDRLECNTAGATDTVELAIDGFTGATAPEIFAYDVTDWNDVARLSVDPAQIEDLGGTWRVRLRTVTSFAAIRRFDVSSVIRQVSSAAIAADVPSSLYLTGPGAADLVIVAHGAFAADCQPLVSHRQAQGISTLLARAQDVYDEFNGGRKSHYAVRRFLRYALENWGTRFVLLVGDGSEDAQGRLGTSAPDYVPTPVIQGPVSPGTIGFEAVPGDNWYVLELGPPGGALDEFLADMVIGRWTAGSAAEVQGLVAKTIAYETPPFDEPWRNRAILSADDSYSDQTTFGGGGGSVEYCFRSSELIFRAINLRCRQLILSDAGFRDYDAHLHLLGDTLASLPTFPGVACPIVRDKPSTLTYVSDFTGPRLYDLLSEGAAFYNFQGHANVVQMTHEELYVAFQSRQSIDLISNFGKPWFYSGYACHVNAFAAVTEGGSFGDGLGERMVNAAGKGAIATFASTGFEVLPFGVENHPNTHVYRAFFVDPPYDEFAGQKGARVLIGEAATLGMARMVANNSTIERRASLTYTLLGDPVAAMSFGAPRLYAEAPDAGVLRSGVPYLPTGPSDSVSVQVEVVDESYLSELTLRLEGEVPAGAVPDTDYAITPTFPDTGSGKRYFIDYHGTPPPASHDVVFTAKDRFGLTGEFRLRFELAAALSAGGQIVRDGDAGVSGAEYLWQVRSPVELFAGDFAVSVKGAAVPFVAQASPADTTGRLWEVRFTPTYDAGPNAVQIDVALARGGVSRTVTLQVGEGTRFDNVFAFPSPFRDFTTFNFNLATGQETDVLLRVFSVAGRLVYERFERGLFPGYHQWTWDGRDASGHEVGFGAYVYRIAATNAGGERTHFEGKLAKSPVVPVESSASGP